MRPRSRSTRSLTSCSRCLPDPAPNPGQPISYPGDACRGALPYMHAGEPSHTCMQGSPLIHACRGALSYMQQDYVNVVGHVCRRALSSPTYTRTCMHAYAHARRHAGMRAGEPAPLLVSTLLSARSLGFDSCPEAPLYPVPSAHWASARDSCPEASLYPVPCTLRSLGFGSRLVPGRRLLLCWVCLRTYLSIGCTVSK